MLLSCGFSLPPGRTDLHEANSTRRQQRERPDSIDKAAQEVPFEGG